MSPPQDKPWTPNTTTCGKTLSQQFSACWWDWHSCMMSCILLQKVITWPVFCELIVMDLDSTLGVCCLPWPSPSQEPAAHLASWMHEFPAPEGSVKKYNRFILPSLESHFNHNQLGDFPWQMGDVLWRKYISVIASSLRRENSERHGNPIKI